MRYVALRQLTYVGQDGATHAVLPGEAVPGFEAWPYAIRHANIQSHTVMDREALTPTIVAGELRMACFEQDGGTAKQAQGVVDGVDEADGPDDDAPEAVVEECLAQGAQQALHLCPHCAHPGFAKANSLTVHIRRKHA